MYLGDYRFNWKIGYLYIDIYVWKNKKTKLHMLNDKLIMEAVITRKL